MTVNSGKLRTFGVGLWMSSVQQMIRHAQLAEELGFGACWVAEDQFWRGGFSLASTLAAHTRCMRIGIATINPYTRNPVLTAMETAALGEAAGPDRVIVAFGASVKMVMNQLGIAWTKPRRSLQEAIEIVLALLRGETVNYQGQCFQVSNAKFAYAPLPQVRIYMGVVGPKNLALAGEIAEGLMITPMASPKYVQYAIAQVSAAARSKGRNVDGFDVPAYLLISMDKDRKRARDVLKPFLGMMIGVYGMHHPDPLLTVPGLKMEEIKLLSEAVMQGRDPSPLVTDWMLDTFTISGEPEECQERYRLMLDAGITTAVPIEVPGLDFEATIRNVKQFLFPVLESRVS
jgi:5,10-methylenetetrahydromethanopterin reductase